MGKNIVYRDLSEGPVEVCKDICNELLEYQASKAFKLKEVLTNMNFENRLKLSFDSASEKFLLVTLNGNEPIGYVYCTAEIVEEGDIFEKPIWAREFPDEYEGLYPKNLKTPSKIATLNNLYVKPEYQGLNIGKNLIEEAMKWIYSVNSLDYIFVYISNGNNVEELYKKHGFVFNHSVYNGFISAYVIKP